MSKPKFVLIGDNKDALYHPLYHVKDSITSILSHVELDIYERNEFDDSFQAYQGLLMYVDAWEKTLQPKSMAALLTYIANGGAMICLHNGISFQANDEYAQLVGAVFTGHPPYQTVNYKMVKEHPITNGLLDFQMEEELYEFEFDPFVKLDILVECSNGEKTMPAVWWRKYGLGKVIYIAPGHDDKSFQNPTLQRLIVNSVNWCIRKEDGQ
ncbi:ThuA domain-containing protein [Alkalihalobacillus sp. LMS39]|uniref:ThuA domain-containing protein n=1 Tax=Alkalihalobacillus sp. LMS39 TaxID=2924032 RepID=UPI001FB56501|nr:ThuA domain-containing protein [Alkalihalobacillus sp. LMS39]UOE95347.1 ThuA domain-containing protein [Alkalihalobacillus sp. LMS39]